MSRRSAGSRDRARTPPIAPAASRCLVVGTVALCGAVFAFLVVQQARSTSATYDETSYLASGYSHLRWSDYRMMPEHPPLLKKLVALPMLAQRPWPADVELSPPGAATGSRREVERAWAIGLDRANAQWDFAHAVLYGLRDEALARLGVARTVDAPAAAKLGEADYLNPADRLLFLGRMTVMGLGLGLALLVFAWARELYGPWGGLLALILCCLDPNIIAHSGLVTMDVGVTLFMFGSVYFLWRACRRLAPADVALFVLCAVLALLTKSIAVLLAPTGAILLLGRVVSAKPWPIGTGERWSIESLRGRALAASGLLAAALVASYVGIWAAYGFRYSAAHDPELAARAEASLASEHAFRGGERGRLPIDYVLNQRARRDVQYRDFSTSMGPSSETIRVIARHRLLPEAYAYGVAYQTVAAMARPGFLLGEHSVFGFWNFFLWTFALKTPVITLTAVLAAVAFAVRRRDPWSSRLAFLVVPVVVVWAVSLRLHVNIGHRYLLPIYPFLFVLCGGLAVEWARLRPATRVRLAAVFLVGVVATHVLVFAPPWRPAVVHPHYLAYFNEIAGGPRRGYLSLVDSSLDWGQDLKGLRRWLDRHSPAEPIHLAYFGTADPHYYGIAYRNAPHPMGGYRYAPAPSVEEFVASLRAGAHLAISATHLQGVYMEAGPAELWRRILARSTLIDTIGYTIFIYRIGG